MGRKKAGHGGGGGGHDGGGGMRWLLTYSDVVTLLLALFIFLFSISKIDAAKLKGLSESFALLFGIGSGGQGKIQAQLAATSPGLLPESRGAAQSVPTDANKSNFQSIVDVKRAKKLEKQILSEMGNLNENIRVMRDYRGVNIILPANILFDPADDVIQMSAYRILKKIGAFLFDLEDYAFMIEGHTDTTPIRSVRFPTNWHLSAARAVSVVRFLHDECGISNTILSVSGRGEFAPLVPNDTEKNRAQNRRVEIVIQPIQPPRTAQMLTTDLPEKNPPPAAT